MYCTMLCRCCSLLSLHPCSGRWWSSTLRRKTRVWSGLQWHTSGIRRLNAARESWLLCVSCDDFDQQETFQLSVVVLCQRSAFKWWSARSLHCNNYMNIIIISWNQGCPIYGKLRFLRILITCFRVNFFGYYPKSQDFLEFRLGNPVKCTNKKLSPYFHCAILSKIILCFWTITDDQ